MSIRAVLFDLGQTLLEYPGNTHEFWQGFLAERLAEMQPSLRQIGVQVGDDADAFVARAMDVMWPERKINMSGKAWHFHDRLRALMESYGGGRCHDSECERLTDAFYKPIGEATRRYPETLDVLGSLKKRGILMAIISNAPWDVPGRLLRADMRKWEIERFFDAFVMSGDVPWRKPNPEFMWAAARKLGVGPEECLVVGDSLKADVAGANAAGMRSVWVNREAQTAAADQPRPDWTLTDLAELAGIVVPRAS